MRGIIHAHSRYSYDGSLSLEELRDLFVARGLRFACMTEHTDHLAREAAEQFITECRSLSDDQFVFIPGFEVPYLENHVLVLGVDHYYADAGRVVLERYAEDGGILIQAHPQRNGYRLDPFLEQHLRGIEIWNGQYDGIHAPRHASYALLRTHESFSAFGGLDLHRATHLRGPILEIDGPLSEQSVCMALRQGDYHIRQGNVLLSATGDVLSGTLQVAILGRVMPVMISILQTMSSLLHRFGIRTFPLKRWLRKHV